MRDGHVQSINTVLSVYTRNTIAYDDVEFTVYDNNNNNIIVPTRVGIHLCI